MGKLTQLAVKNARRGKHFDGGGLYVEVTRTGSRLWRLKYRFAGKEKRLALGAFPAVSLADARDKAAKARALLVDGIDPGADRAERISAAKRVAGAAFPKVAADWLEFKKRGWADETYRKAQFVIDEYLAPALRSQSISTLTSKDAANALADMPPSLAIKARGYLGNIAEYAMREGLRDDGRVLSLRGVLAHAAKVKGHIPAATTLAEVSEVAKAIETYPTPVVRAALKVAMLTAQRPGNVAAMEWGHVDLDQAEWHIPAELMKTRHSHIVPLPQQAVQVLRAMGAYTAGQRYVFPPLARQKTEHLHRDALSLALRKLGFQGRHATHGFRGMFRTLARERLGVSADVLEAQLAHAKKDEIQKAYDRTSFIAERQVAMQQWADFLDEITRRDNVVPLRAS